MFRSGPLGEEAQKNGGPSGQLHESIVSGAFWPGVETSGLIAINNCALIVSAPFICLLIQLPIHTCCSIYSGSVSLILVDFVFRFSPEVFLYSHRLRDL